MNKQINKQINKLSHFLSRFLFLLEATIEFILLLDFLTIEKISLSERVKRNVIISIKLVYTSCLTSCQRT